MADCVLDASVIGYANGDLRGRRPRNVLDRRLTVIERVATGDLRPRYNPKLLGEYRTITKKEVRNDVIELFFAILDSERAIFVARNTLSRHNHQRAKRCRWPNHDQHLIAAAINGEDTSLFVTEQRLADCGAQLRAQFGILVEHLS